MSSQYRISPPPEESSLASVSGPLAVGTTLDRWIPMSAWTSTQHSSGGAAGANLLRAFPILLAQGRTISDIAVNVLSAAAAGSVVRCGLYLDNGATYPGQLVQDFGELTTASTGVKTITGLNRKLESGNLYWAAIWQSAGPTLRAIDSNGMYPILGSSSSLGGNSGVGWEVSKTYTLGSSVLPSTFDAGASVIFGVSTAPYPIWFARFSS